MSNSKNYAADKDLQNYSFMQKSIPTHDLTKELDTSTVELGFTPPSELNATTRINNNNNNSTTQNATKQEGSEHRRSTLTRSRARNNFSGDNSVHRSNGNFHPNNSSVHGHLRRERNNQSNPYNDIHHGNNEELSDFPGANGRDETSQHMVHKYNADKDKYNNGDNLDLTNKKIINMSELRSKPLCELMELAQKYNVANTNRMPKQDVICAILRQATSMNEIVYGEGVLEFVGEHFGFLRSMNHNYVSAPDDVYVSQNQIKRFNLRNGDTVTGYVREPKRNERYFAMLKVDTINGHSLEKSKNKIDFDDLVPLYPKKKLNLDMPAEEGGSVSTRIIDLIAPIGKGQRALIVAPPRSGKTVLMQNIAHAININHPEVYLIVLLIDERPEEVTDMQRSVKGEVVSSTFDEPASRHIALAEIVIAKSKRIVEEGRDVVILLDNITRLARAYNAVIPSSGKVLTGGVDSNALQRPKRFLGAARNTENGGSLTIIATALVDTGSKMDEVIFEEFKGTGNSEIVLDRKLGEKRIFPALDINKSGTRREEEMIDPETLLRMGMLRRIVIKTNEQSNADALEFLIKKVKETSNNAEFFLKMNSVSKS